MSSAEQSRVDPRLAKLQVGEPLEFAVSSKGEEETQTEKKGRTIPAKWLEDLAARPAGVVSVPIKISHAIIEGGLNLEYATFEAELSIADSEFTGEVVSSFATFKRAANFQGSRFCKEANFRGAHAEGDFVIGRASFADGAIFQDLHVDEVLTAAGASFGSVTFERIEVAKDALFHTDNKGHRVEFGGDAIFRGARIQGQASFVGAEFKSRANFDSLQVDGPAFFRTDDKGQRVQFGGDAIFRRAHIKSNAEFDGAAFKSRASFDSLQVDGLALFRANDKGQCVQFGGDANFRGAHIGSNAEFVNAEFESEADFDNLQVDGLALFRTVEFGGDAIFRGARIQGQANFVGAEFKSRANFDSLLVDGPAFFRTDDKGQRVQFGGDAIFCGAHIHGQANFVGAEFKSRANFDRLQVDGLALFRADHKGQCVQFGGDAIFRGAHIGNDAGFDGAEFKGSCVNFDNAQFKGAAKFNSVEFDTLARTTFIGARFERGAYFNSAQFRGSTDFTAAVADRDAQFTGAQMSGPASFREARFQVVFFGELSRTWKKDPELLNPTVFGGQLDLRGFTYERIYVLLRDLFPKLQPFDRQPYALLESALRKVGDDRTAHQVYLERRRVERRQKFRPRTIHLWLLDWLYKLGANYGVRPYQLVAYALAFVLLGAILFSQPGALERKKESSAQTPTKIDPAGVGLWKGLEVSVHYFLPMDTPVGGDLVPTTGRVPIRVKVGNWSRIYQLWLSASWYATIFLRVGGSILMGIGLAATTGLLRRIAP